MNILTTAENDFKARTCSLLATKAEFEKQYEAIKGTIVADLQKHVSAHQTVVDAHSAEVKAGGDLIAKLSLVAAVAGETPQIILSTQPGTVKKVTAFVQGHWRWMLMGGCALFLAHKALHLY